MVATYRNISFYVFSTFILRVASAFQPTIRPSATNLASQFVDGVIPKTISVEGSCWKEENQLQWKSHRQHAFMRRKALYASTMATVEVSETEQEKDGPSTNIAPQVFATGYSNKMDLSDALKEALDAAVKSLPPIVPEDVSNRVDLALVVVSSLYDSQSTSKTPINDVPSFIVRRCEEKHGRTITNLIGCTTGGIFSSSLNNDKRPFPGRKSAKNEENKESPIHTVFPVETEGMAGVSITLIQMPDVKMASFHVAGNDVPDDVTQALAPSSDWMKSLDLLNDSELASTTSQSDAPLANNTQTETDGIPYIFMMPSPAFQNKVHSFLSALSTTMPKSKVVGGIASTVSSLSRPRLFQYSATASSPSKSLELSTYAEGCVGVVMQGDLEVDMLLATGAKPVGDTYRVFAGTDSTILALQSEEEDNNHAKEKKASGRPTIPRPPLAEANYLLKNVLSDDDAAFMKKTLLIGVQQRPSTPGENPFTVYEVASAGAKDGSVTLPLGSVKFKGGEKVKFFVRHGTYGKEEVQSLWDRYSESIKGDPSGCIIVPTFDRGNKFFGGKGGFESNVVAQSLPNIPSISGFYSNGSISPAKEMGKKNSEIHGSGTSFAIFRSKSKRSTFNPIAPKDSKEEDSATSSTASSFAEMSNENDERSPRSEDGELILKRREVHSGRAISVSTVQWSVAEKTATPTSALEGWMWDKEAEVDRFRERVPLANLLSQVKLATMDPENPGPRDWIGSFVNGSDKDSFFIVPELKKTDPVDGSLREKYLPDQLSGNWVDEKKVVPGIALNVDAVLFGGSLDDITKTKSKATGVPVLVSDLILYPYQLYKLRLAQADAVTFVAAALSAKDLSYLIKIASTLGFQAVVSVTSEVQLERVTASDLKKGLISALIVSNREWEDITVDGSGEQALELLRSSSLKGFREKFGEEVPILVDGGVGVIEMEGSTSKYIEALKDAGANGAIVGRALATQKSLDNPFLSEYVQT